MNIKPYHNLAARALLWATIQFMVLTVIAMFAYPGGHAHNPEISYYSFTLNYFSDLGVTKTLNGKENFISQLLFELALGGAGVGMICFAFTTTIYNHGFEKRTLLVNIATMMLGFSGACFIAIAALPIDLYFIEHNFFVKTAFSLLLGYSLVIWTLQVRNSWPKRYVRSNVFYMFSLMVYVYILFVGPSYETLSGLKFQVISQKTIAYVSVLNLGYQAVGILRKTRQVLVKEIA